MKRYGLTITLICLAISIGICYRLSTREREVVILSTNDMHASLGNFARLATAVQECRDTVSTVLVDAGDRWTGNAFVDLAEGRLPIIDLMNELGYDAATLGNHEFDMGSKTLATAISHAKFPIVCANIESQTEALPTPPSCLTLKTESDLRLNICGVVTNYDNGHPDGNHETFEGLHFPDPMQSATKALQESSRGDVKILLSHMGDDKDMEYASSFNGYDIIIGGHTHVVVDTIIGKTVVGQTGRKLKNVGVTRIRTKGCRIKSIEYENIPLSNYEPDPHFVERIAQIESNPELCQSIGTLGVNLDKAGLANLETELIAKATKADIAFYHYGGIRYDELDAGGISLATLFNLEPFSSTLYTMDMTTEQMRHMIIAKFNDRLNTKESHRIDLFCSTPYDIVVDGTGEAVDVRFPRLKEGKTYRVALGDYIFKKYPGIEAENVKHVPTKLLDILADHFRQHSPVTASNTPKQRIITRK